MKINEVTQVNEVNWGAVGGIAKSLGGAAIKGIGKAVAAGLDPNLGKALGAGQTTQVTKTPDQIRADMQEMSKKLAPNLAKQWGGIAQQLIADQQAGMPPGTIAQWKDVPVATKLEKLDALINSTLTGVMPKVRDYKQLANFVEDDPYSQDLATRAIRVIDMIRDTFSKPSMPANPLQSWQNLVTGIVSAAKVAGRREGSTTKQSPVEFDKATGKWTYNDKPLDPKDPAQRAAQAEYIRLNPGWASP